MQAVFAAGEHRTGRVHKEETMFDCITFAAKIMGGRVCIRGIRIPVSIIVGQLRSRSQMGRSA